MTAISVKMLLALTRCFRSHSVQRLMYHVDKLELHSKIIRPNHSLTSITLIGG